MPEQRTIRVIILCKGTELPRWQAQAIRHLLEVPGVELVAVGTPRSDDAPWVGAVGPKAYVEKRCLSLLIQRANLLEDLSDPLASVPGVELSPDPLRFGERATWSAFAPDLLISFLPSMAANALPDPKTHHPVWEFRFGGQGIGSNGLLGMRSRFTRDRSLEVQFRSSTEKKAITATFPLRTEDGEASLDLVLAGAGWLPAKLATTLLADPGEGIGSTLIETEQKTDYQDNMIVSIRSWIDLELYRLRSQERQGPTHGEWNIGVLHQPISSLLDEEASTNVRWLPSPSEGNHRMEPFGYTALDGQLNVLYRKKHRHKPIDEIARLRPKSDSVLKRSRSMLTTSASLHYPFVVERPDGAYAIISYPHQDKTELFRVADSNDRMDHVKTLMNRALTSPTLIHFEGLWWLLGTDPDAADSVLLAYHSQAMDGPFLPHPLNPLKVDSVGTRPAGTPFVHGTDLWRPALDTSDPSTVTIILNRVDTLTTRTFHESAGRRLTGFRGTVYSNGIRTISAMGDLTLIDGLRGTTSEKIQGKAHTSTKRSKKRRS
ncbi:MAG TPA: hypothetical protein PLB89_12245 [Flavobacteriales bacterium]|nr:hypothetical protein [Flavobacteriales bacterium]